MTTKSDVYAFGVVLAELITGLRALMRDKKEVNKMKSLISIVRAHENTLERLFFFLFSFFGLLTYFQQGVNNTMKTINICHSVYR